MSSRVGAAAGVTAAFVVATGLLLGVPAIAYAGEGELTFELSDRSMTCTLAGLQVPYVAEMDCELKSPGFGFDFPQPKCDPGSPVGVQIMSGDAGASQAKYVCTDSGGGGSFAQPGDFFVNDPFECRVIDDEQGAGVNCRNLYYGSGFRLQHGSYQLFEPHVPSGLDTCSPGFVWREARATPLDHVCVTPGSKAATQRENADTDKNAEPDGTCKAGFVAREAFHGDEVCVTLTRRDEAKSDDATAAERRVAVPW